MAHEGNRDRSNPSGSRVYESDDLSGPRSVDSIKARDENKSHTLRPNTCLQTNRSPKLSDSPCIQGPSIHAPRSVLVY